MAAGLPALLVSAFAVAEASAVVVPPWDAAHFDRRLVLEPQTHRPASDSELLAFEALRQQVPGLQVAFDDFTGGTRSLVNPVGLLIDAPSRGDAEAIARRFARENLAALRLTESDVAELSLIDRVVSARSGVVHLHFEQRFRGTPVLGGGLHVNVTREGQIVSVHSALIPRIAEVAQARAPEVGVDDVLARLKARLGDVEFATESAPPRLAYLPIRPGEARLVWSFDLASPDRSRWWAATVDALDGVLWTLDDRASHAQYLVYSPPIEHPGVAVPAPPGDARSVVVDPPQPDASPFGWHDVDGIPGPESTLTTGNNVDAYTDIDANNLPDPDSRPDGGLTLEFSPPLDLALEPSANRPAAVVNLFHWMNFAHDVESVHGFDEVAGNFQTNNYGRGGLGGDAVRAEAQDGSGTCGGVMSTAADGVAPRLQAYVSSASCSPGSPAHDGAFDNLVQVHEYGHGISSRLVGGPSNPNCLFNAEHPGEGLSDWWGLTLTAAAAQSGPTPRTVGGWLFAGFPNGIRPFPYSTDDALNADTYAISNTRPGAHGVGSVWAQLAWQVYWALVDAHGFDADLTNVSGTSADAGNLRAKSYVIEGLKNAPCSPGFVDVRDGILAAVTTLYDGADLCTVWRAFAAGGLGFSASQGSSMSATDQVESFDLPAACAEIFDDAFESGDTGEWSATEP